MTELPGNGVVPNPAMLARQVNFEDGQAAVDAIEQALTEAVCSRVREQLEIARALLHRPRRR